MRNASEGVEGGVHACMRALSAPPSRDEGRHVAVVPACQLQRVNKRREEELQDFKARFQSSLITAKSVR